MDFSIVFLNLRPIEFVVPTVKKYIAQRQTYADTRIQFVGVLSMSFSHTVKWIDAGRHLLG